MRFISNIDPTDVYEKTHDLDPAETLVIVSSKTFTTLAETPPPSTRSAGCSRDLDRTLTTTPSPSTSSRCLRTPRRSAFGIDTENMFGFWDWVGGRYSYDSAIGLS